MPTNLLTLNENPVVLFLCFVACNAKLVNAVLSIDIHIHHCVRKVPFFFLSLATLIIAIILSSTAVSFPYT